MEEREPAMNPQSNEGALASELNPATDFVALDPSADAWDDSVLIDAFNRAVASHKRHAAKIMKPKQTQVRKRVPSKSKTHLPLPKEIIPHSPATTPITTPAATAVPAIQENISFPPPPPPPHSSPEMKDLLAAWYEAGYRAGLYAARQESPAR